MAEQKEVQVTQGRTELTAEGPTRTPLVDIYETDAGLTLVAEMPGVDRDSVSVEMEKGVLTISGQAKAPETAGFSPLYEGMAVGGNFYRAFALSDEIDRNRTTAAVKDGVLTIQLPKAEQARTRRIQVSAGD